MLVAAPSWSSLLVLESTLCYSSLSQAGAFSKAFEPNVQRIRCEQALLSLRVLWNGLWTVMPPSAVKPFPAVAACHRICGAEATGSTVEAMATVANGADSALMTILAGCRMFLLRCGLWVSGQLLCAHSSRIFFTRMGHERKPFFCGAFEQMRQPTRNLHIAIHCMAS